MGRYIKEVGGSHKSQSFGLNKVDKYLNTFSLVQFTQTLYQRDNISLQF